MRLCMVRTATSNPDLLMVISIIIAVLNTCTLRVLMGSMVMAFLVAPNLQACSTGADEEKMFL